VSSITLPIDLNEPKNCSANEMRSPLLGFSSINVDTLPIEVDASPIGVDVSLAIDVDTLPIGVDTAPAIDVDTSLIDANTSTVHTPIDVDALDEQSLALRPNSVNTQQCCGIMITFPAGTSPHSSYPYGIHDELWDPWDYTVTGGVMALHAKRCSDIPQRLIGSGRCERCEMLTENANLQGIIRRIETGVHENTHLVYHSIGGLITLVRRKTGKVKALRLRRLNDARKLAGKAVVLDDMKRWVMAVGSGKVERVDRLVRVNLTRNGGIRNLLELYDRAARQVYHPQNYTEEDDLRGLLLWRLGGARVAGIAHRALNLPSLSTLRRRTIIPRLLVSALTPSRLEVETNVISNFEDIKNLLETHQVVHQVLMLDELKTEERLRHDPDSNKFQGVCREHGHKTSLEFNSEKEVDLLLEAVDKGELHVTVEVWFENSQLLACSHDLIGDCGGNWCVER